MHILNCCLTFVAVYMCSLISLLITCKTIFRFLSCSMDNFLSLVFEEIELSIHGNIFKSSPGSVEKQENAVVMWVTFSHCTLMTDSVGYMYMYM